MGLVGEMGETGELVHCPVMLAVMEENAVQVKGDWLRYRKSDIRVAQKYIPDSSKYPDSLPLRQGREKASGRVYRGRELGKYTSWPRQELGFSYPDYLHPYVDLVPRTLLP